MTLDSEIEAEIMEGVALKNRTPKLMDILEAVCATYKVSKLEVMSARRFAYIVSARNAFYWCAYNFTVRSHPEIGRFIGDRDHSTVIYGVSRINTRFSNHKATLASIAQRLGLPPDAVPENAYGNRTRRMK